jgi:hypothetical protein
MNLWRHNESCDTCGRFISIGALGVSWAQQWSYSMDGTPDLHDPRYRCSACTDKRGIPSTNCGNPENYHGRNPVP